MKKKTLILLPVLLGIGLGVGLGIGTIGGKTKPAKHGNEIAIEFEDDDEEVETSATSEESYSDGDEIVLDANALLPAAPVNIQPSSAGARKPAASAAAKARAKSDQTPASQSAAVVTDKPQTSTETPKENAKSNDSGSFQAPDSGAVAAGSGDTERKGKISEEDIQSDISGYYNASVTPEQMAADYRNRLPIRVGKYQTLTDFTYGKKDGFTYHIKTTRDDITAKMKTSLPDYACDNKQVQIFMQYVDKVNFRFTNNHDQYLQTISIPKSECDARMKKKYSGG